jgi:ribosomal-protein-alanine N-acetyltransferase
VEIRAAVDADRPRLAAFAASLQVRPERHIAYLGLDAATIAAEMVAEDDDWAAVAVVAEDRDRVVGWLMGSVDADMGRVWWFGPFVDDGPRGWDAVATALYDVALAGLPDGIIEQELAIDARFEMLERWAIELGFHTEEASAVLVLDRPVDAPSIATRPVTAADVTTVGRLHDELFPGTHTTGHGLVAGADASHVRLVAEDGDGLIGYVAVERQPDGEGYVDFLGVAPDRRRRGFGSELVRAGVDALRKIGCSRVSLTVREGNAAARSVYRSLGFTEERLLRPLRKGFRLP